MSTIKQIAQIAGVSPTTVSNVINGNTTKVSLETREKVEVVLRQQNYAPNMAAHILAHNRSRIVGVIMFMEPRRNETVFEDPFSSTILGTIEAELRRHDYYMMVHTTSDEEEILHLSRAWKLSGLILVWAPANIMGALRHGIKTPVVFIDSYFSGDDLSFHGVGLDDRQGGYEIARYVLSMGHRELVFLANDRVFPGTDYERFLGCRQAMAEHGFPFEEERLIPLSKDRQKRYALYSRLAEKPFTFSALVFSADYYAAEAIVYLREIGIQVPQDLSITGFDDNIFSRVVSPRITTVHQNVEEKGKVAVDLLMKSLHKESIPENPIRLPVRLEIRESVRRIDAVVDSTN